jgi:hypothetical protein
LSASFARILAGSVSLVACLCLVVSVPLTPASASQTGVFSFALIGDIGYTEDEEAEIANLMAEIDNHDLAFVIHDGDFKGGPPGQVARSGQIGLCSDELYAQRLVSFQASRHPLVFTPGDNDWTDCHAPAQGSYEPLERLATLRRMFFPGSETLGQRKLPLRRQTDDSTYAAYRENVRWSYGDVTFITLHIVGSNNNLGREPVADAEHAERGLANLAWLAAGFEEAKRDDSRAVLITIQANPRFERPPGERTGYNDFLAALESELLAFAGPVVLVHGDTHYFRVDKPLVAQTSRRRIEHFTRVETFGSPDVHWVLATVDPADPNVFSFSPMLVRANLVDHTSASSE